MKWLSLGFGFLTLVSIVVGGLVTKKFRDRLGILAGFSAGTLIGVSFFDLIPAGIEIHRIEGMEKVFIPVVIGFVFLYVIERYINIHYHCEENVCKNIRHKHSGWIGSTEIVVHSIVDGMAIGLSFQQSLHTGLLVSVAVICHSFSHGINIMTAMLSAGNSLKHSLQMLAMDAVAPFIGVCLSLILTIPESVLGYVLPFFAGSFIYLGASELLPRAHEETPPGIAVLSVLAGLIVLFLLTRIVSV